MGISKKYLAENVVPVHFDLDELAEELRNKLPEAQFCLLMGSACDGIVKAYSDLDLAFYVDSDHSWEFLCKVSDLVHEVVGEVRCDVGILNTAEPVYRFEALKGKLLFARDLEFYASFFSRTCREYESQMFDYGRQHSYRKEAARAV